MRRHFQQIVWKVEPSGAIRVEAANGDFKMRNFILNSAMAAVLGFGGMSFGPLAAQAQDIQLELGRDGPQLRVLDNCDPDVEDCRDRRHESRSERRERERREQEQREVRRCTPDRALDKADRMGVRRARIDSVGRRTIEVRGRSRNGERVHITFGRSRNCPVIG